MGFIAQDSVEPLDYDLDPYAGKGTVPEPTDKQIRTFRRGIVELAKASLPEGEAQAIDDPVAAVGALAALAPEEMDRADDQTLDLLAALCGGQPSKADLKKLPPRVRQSFAGWLSGMLFGSPENPTRQSATTRRSQAIRNGAAIAG